MASQMSLSAPAGAPSTTRRAAHRHRVGDDDRFVFTARVRRAGAWYVAVTVPLCGLVAWSPRDERSYLLTMVAVALVYTVPGLVIAIVAAARAAPGDRVVWRLWAASFGLSCVSFLLAYGHVDVGLAMVQRWSVPFTAALVLVRMVAGSLILRARSGERAALLDAIDLAMATTALTVPVGLLVGDRVVGSPNAWFTVAASIWTIGACYGLLVSLVMRARLHPAERGLVHLAIAVEAVIMATSAGHVLQGLRGFELPAGPFVGCFALSFGLSVLFFLSSAQRPSSGLERFPAAAQVRRQSLITVLVLVAAPLIGLEAWLLRDSPWVVTTAMVAALALLVLSGVRHLLSGRETLRLYAAVEQAARQRGELLTEVMAHVDADRHRVAGHLHRQASALHTAMTSFTSAIDASGSHRSPTPAGFAAERLRADLSRQVDALRQLSIGVAPLAGAPGGINRLAAPMRAYVENLYGDGPGPEVSVEVAPDLSLDWTTEAILLRIVQEAAHLVRRRADAGTLRIAVTASGRAVLVEVVDDGAGGVPDPTDVRVAAMRAMARFSGGDVEITGTQSEGTRVRARIGLASDPPPRLRLVPDP